MPRCWFRAQRGQIGGQTAKDTTPTPSREWLRRPPGDTLATTVLPPEPGVFAAPRTGPQDSTFQTLPVLLHPQLPREISMFLQGRDILIPL